MKENNGTKSKEKKLNKKNNLINESNKQNKDKYKIKEKINKIKNFSLNSDNKSKRIFDLYKKQDKIGLSNSNSKLLISNNLYNINYTNKEINKNNNSSKKEDMHKDYFNFKKIIKNNFNNINNFQITDFLLTSKQGLPKKNPYINFQKSVNISLKKINSDVSSRNDSPKKNKKLHLQGRNDILSKYVKSNFNSTNISKVNNIYTTWNSFENNISSNNIIEEEINKKNYKIIKIFKNKKNLDENVCSDKNKDKKLTNNDSKIFNNKIYNNSIIKIKCALINKRNGSSNNILHIKNFKNKIILNNNNHDKNIKCNLLKNTNHYESIKKNEITSVFYRKTKNNNNYKNLYSNNINKKSNLWKNKISMDEGNSKNNKQSKNENKNYYKNKKIINISNYNKFFDKSYSKSNLFCKTNIIYSYKK